MQEITIRHEVPMGHRLPKHAGKCRFPHGHNYLFEITVKGPVDEPTGMIIDFSEVKKYIKDFFEQFDHAMVLDERDPFVSIMRWSRSGDVIDFVYRDGDSRKLTGIPTKCVILNCPPTAENIAQLVANHIPYQCSVTVYETRDCSAKAWPNDRAVDIVEVW